VSTHKNYLRFEIDYDENFRYQDVLENVSNFYLINLFKKIHCRVFHDVDDDVVDHNVVDDVVDHDVVDDDVPNDYSLIINEMFKIIKQNNKQTSSMYLILIPRIIKIIS
jgi:hypothetical protein